jgi:hypothetical protein
MPSPRSLALAVAVAAVTAAVAAAAPRGHAYRNDGARVRSFEPPQSWQPAPQASYPRLLCGYSHPDGGRLTLTTQKVGPGTTADALARAAVLSLARQGFSDIQRAPDGDRVRLEARIDGGRRFLKQLYLVDGGAAWVISLVAATINQPQMERDFESAVRSLVIDDSPTGDGGVR